MTEGELKDMILECICYLIEDGSMNELLRDVIMEVLTDVTPLVKVAVHQYDEYRQLVLHGDFFMERELTKVGIIYNGRTDWKVLSHFSDYTVEYETTMTYSEALAKGRKKFREFLSAKELYEITYSRSKHISRRRK